MAQDKAPMRAHNIKALVDYFKSGIKSTTEKIGIELEHTLVHADGRPVSYSDEYGQRWILKQLKSEYPTDMIDAEGTLVGIANDHATVTLEPAAQFEISAGPFADLNDAARALNAFESTVKDLVSQTDIDILTPGYHPTARAVDLTLIPKRRYEIMNEYLGAISKFGICMMRGSAATQVSIDYTSVQDCLLKMRLASACAPILALITDNSPVFEAAPRPHAMMRTEIWEKCDPARCNTVPGLMDADFTLEDYAAYILDTPAMVDISTGSMQLSSEKFGDLYADIPMTEKDVMHVLSAFFNDVRLKTYIEIRPADAMPIPCVIAYAALIKGLFYDDASLGALASLFKDVSEQDIWDAKYALMKDGYDGQAYGQPVSVLADELISIAAQGLGADEVDLLLPLSELVAARTTLANIAEEQHMDD